jgi:hypothetical protein
MLTRMAWGLAALLFAGSVRAQSVPAEPTPDAAARTIGAQASKDPDAASASLADLFRRLASPQVILPTWDEVQSAQWNRTAAGEREAGANAAGASGVLPLSDDGLRHFHRQSIDVTLSRPLPRVGLGAGWSETDVRRGEQRQRGREYRYLQLTIDLSRFPRPARFVVPPLVTHRESETGSPNMRVRTDEHVVDSLKLPKN